MAGAQRMVRLDRFPEDAHHAWARLIGDVIGGGGAPTALIAALDAPVEPLLAGVDVDAALAADHRSLDTGQVAVVHTLLLEPAVVAAS